VDEEASHIGNNNRNRNKIKGLVKILMFCLKKNETFLDGTFVVVLLSSFNKYISIKKRIINNINQIYYIVTSNHVLLVTTIPYMIINCIKLKILLSIIWCVL
jgi:hypothetical protein